MVLLTTKTIVASTLFIIGRDIGAGHGVVLGGAVMIYHIRPVWCSLGTSDGVDHLGGNDLGSRNDLGSKGLSAAVDNDTINNRALNQPVVVAEAGDASINA